MSSGQQIIKIIAIIFATFLIVNIFGWIIFGLSAIFGISFITDNTSQDTKINEFSNVYTENIESVKIETAISKLTIQSGDELKVEGSNLPSKFSSKIVGNKLVVKEDGNRKWFQEDITSTITITIPKDKTLNNLELKAGIGNHNIQDITANNFDLDSGVGIMQINNVTILSKTKIEGGAGKTTIQNSKLEKLDLEAGVGEMIISADITGDSKIECGVGRVELNLPRKQEEYSITVETGLGRMALNGKKVGGAHTYGTGKNYLKIDGGVGAVEINTL